MPDIIPKVMSRRKTIDFMISPFGTLVRLITRNFERDYTITTNHIEGQLWLWNRQTKLGVAFNSSSGFKLPNGADRSPDASWVKLERWQTLTPKEQEGFAPLCPDFVVELRSKSDNMEPLREKMREYIANGARLGWLIDRKNQKVEIYRQNQDVEILNNPRTLSGGDVLPGFVLDLTDIG